MEVANFISEKIISGHSSGEGSSNDLESDVFCFIFLGRNDSKSVSNKNCRWTLISVVPNGCLINGYLGSEA